MEIKTLEIRDTGTCIPCIAISTKSSNVEQHLLLRRAGYSDCGNSDCILFGMLRGGKLTYDAYAWNGCRTMQTAHSYVRANFDKLREGDVVDVEFILGEKDTPSISDLQEDNKIYAELAELTKELLS